MCACTMGGWSMWLGGLLFWGVLLGFGVWAVRQFSRRAEPADANRILEGRFARGEISAEEFEKRKRVLEGADR